MTSADNNNVDKVLECKKAGNEAFKMKEYGKAVEYYTKALKLGVKGQPAAAIYSNLANVHTKLKEYNEALECSKFAIDMDSQWKKGYYWKGMSHLCLRNFEDAYLAFQNGSTIDTADTEFPQKLKVVEFCKENAIHLDSVEVTDWVTVANSALYNLQVLSTEEIANTLTRLTMKTKLGSKLAQCALMDLQGKLNLETVPVNVLTPADQIISDKMKRGELIKLYVIIFVNGKELPSLNITGCSSKFNSLQQTVIKLLVEHSKKTSFNEHFVKFL
ncbi:uncharacterized protein [Antedon mediterranea]|uniref:uncharacterized protein n=1 Tax=Antedon mediterranea TaxID=105859 RepID=UPI003AF6526E